MRCFLLKYDSLLHRSLCYVIVSGVFLIEAAHLGFISERNLVITVEALEVGSAVIIRPSGTEPKIKAYILARGECEGCANALIAKCEEDCKALLAK